MGESISPISKTSYQTNEAGINGGNSESDRESLLAQLVMSRPKSRTLDRTIVMTNEPTRIIGLSQNREGKEDSRFLLVVQGLKIHEFQPCTLRLTRWRERL
ncbi:hypothetical protein [Umezakia ovalisporum]|uniref:Uncharacterized protein n=1 Tax=Umezakia ovalisporum FSS-43 TaxID=2740520 RepID=A0ABT6JZV3_9CYAN|nr:hypothetical protein [Umezakia ovalisporum]MDH6055622.1 hypothetical protein [Umezakia ovalisporum FSS-43]MDH6071304.1 hypothetical protein [Umezakia ovalisporum CobakiLakeA]MDH6075859.1 hypothetical protein [Umezakia ovalisporum CS-1034]MDH6079266.1 hypothetical protein [Umezakia ovalisporum FSS-45]MDH6079815.1 hypothetical protein [Umezakia ovalisporum FSS-44]